MRWDDERYVRVYVRDTAEWLLWPWQTRALLLMIFRKVDRAGLLPLGKGKLRSLAVVVGMPEDVVTEAIEPLIEDGCVQIKEGVLVVPNFVSAQETRQSDSARKRASRDSAKNVLPVKSPESLHTGVTNGHVPSPSVTTDASPVTAVTASTAQHSTAWLGTAREEAGVEDGPRPTEVRRPEPLPAAGRESGFDVARRVWLELWQRKYRLTYQFGADMGPFSEDRVLQRIGQLAIELGDCELVLRHKISTYLKDPGTRNWLIEHKHPLKSIEKDWVALGEPSTKQPPRSVTRIRPVDAPPPLSAAAIAAQVGGVLASLNPSASQATPPEDAHGET